MGGGLKAAAEEIKAKLDEEVAALKDDPHMAEILRLQKGLNVIEDLLDTPRTSLSSLFAFEDETSPTSIRPDEYYGMTPLNAAKKYLAKRGEARPLAEIVDAIRAGGGKADTDDLRLSLSRSTYEVAKVAEDLYGLVSFYKNLKRQRGKGKKGDGGADVTDGSEPGTEDDEQESAESPSGSES